MDRSLLCAWLALGTLFAAGLPLFLCMATEVDVTLYDLCARNLLDGGVHYRDVWENNFPGIVWLHVAIRRVLGWSSESIRLVDVLIVGADIWLLARWLGRWGRPLPTQVWAAVVLWVFYFSTTEWCHCQRDTWMLLPALWGLALRSGQIKRMGDRAGGAWRVFAAAALEGLCWGAVIWIKPYGIIPALGCWLTSIWCAHRAERLPP